MLLTKDPELRGAWLSALGSMPMLLPVVWFILGLALALRADIWFIISIAAIAMLLIAVEPWIRPDSTIIKRYVVPLIFLSAGFIDAWVQSPVHVAPGEIPRDKAHYSAVVESVSSTASGQSAVVRLDDSDDSIGALRVELFLQFSEPEIVTGERISFTGVLRPVEVIKDVEEEIDPAEILIRRGISAVCFINQPEKVVVTDLTLMARFLKPFAAFGRSLGMEIDKTPLDSFTRALLRTFLTGDRSSVTPFESDMFSAAGVSHMLAISGAHVGVVMVLVSIILLPFLFWGLRRWTGVVALGAVWIFVMVCGCQASAVRAAVMATVMMLSGIFVRQHTSSNSLLISVFIILTVSPEQLFNVGFQLSVGAVAGILIFAGRLNPVPHSYAALRFFADCFAISIAASIVTAPIVALCFHSFPVYFLIGNLIVSLVVPWLMLFGALTVALSASDLPCGFPAAITDALGAWISDGVEATAGLPGSVVTDIYFPSWIMILYIAVVVFLWCGIKAGRRYRRRWILLACGISIFACISLIFSKPSNTPEWIVGRSASVPELIVNSGDTLRVFTYGNDMERQTRLSDIGHRYKAYMASRGLAGPVIMEDDMTYVLDGRCRRGVVTIGQDTVFVIDRHTLRSDIPSRSRYVLFAKGSENYVNLFYGGELRCDTILHFGLSGLNVPDIDLSETQFRRPLRVTPGSSGSSLR